MNDIENRRKVLIQEVLSADGQCWSSAGFSWLSRRSHRNRAKGRAIKNVSRLGRDHVLHVLHTPRGGMAVSKKKKKKQNMQNMQNTLYWSLK